MQQMGTHRDEALAGFEASADGRRFLAERRDDYRPPGDAPGITRQNPDAGPPTRVMKVGQRDADRRLHLRPGQSEEHGCTQRSEQRGGGAAGWHTGRSRWAPAHSKKDTSWNQNVLIASY